MKHYITTFIISCLAFTISQVASAQTKPSTDTLPAPVTVIVNPIPAAYDSTIPVNKVRTFLPTKPLQESYDVTSDYRKANETKQSTEFKDGLGRLLQKVEKASGYNGKDLVAPMMYDKMGRTTFQYVAFPSDSSNTGNFQRNVFKKQDTVLKKYYNPSSNINGEKFFYDKTEYEASPLGRVTKKQPRGNSWVGHNRGASISYEANTAGEVRLWKIDTLQDAVPVSTTTYAAGQLQRTVTTDERGKRSVEYKNKDGMVVLRKLEILESAPAITTHTGWLCTYYVYDDLDQLRFILSPKAVEQISSNWIVTDTVAKELCFTYVYDAKQRQSVKRKPGAGKEYFVYDALDRVIMTQDSVLRGQKKWLILVYDSLDRVTKTVLLSDSLTRASHEAAAWNVINYPVLSGTYEVLSEVYYDNYKWTTAVGMPARFDSTQKNDFVIQASDKVYPYARPVIADYAVKNMVTGTKLKVLGSSSDYLYTVNFYDNKKRLLQSNSTHVAGGKIIITNQYGFDGRKIGVKKTTKITGATKDSIVTITRYTYDSLNRLVLTTLKVNGGPNKVISRLSYDELGKIRTRSLGSLPGDSSKSLETLDYNYNVRGWLTGINKNYVTSGGTNYFGSQLSYDYGFSSSQFTGNVAGITWKGKSDGAQRAYGYSYDAANRLLTADFTQKNSNAWNQSTGLNFDAVVGNDASSAYDANGNIKQLKQQGWKGNASGVVDSLAYTYNNGSNKLVAVKDNGPSTANFALGDFQNGTNTDNDYAYDGNGNVIQDKNKGITSITYNYLNLPSVITVTGKGTITYTYDAGGRKLQKTVTNASNQTTTTSYLDGFVFEKKGSGSNALQYFLHDEGRIRRNRDSSFSYDFFVRDHVGSIRSVLTDERYLENYPAASLEGNVIDTNTAISQENKYYTIDTSRVVATNTIPLYPVYQNNNGIDNPNTKGNQLANSTKAYKLNGVGAGKMGLGITLKVMAGDTINIFGKSYWTVPPPQSIPSNDILAVLTGLLGGPAGLGAAHGVSASDLVGANGGMTTFLSSRPSGGGAPAAYINYVFFDEQFKYAGGDVSVVSPDGYKDHFASDPHLQNIPVPKSGYIYVFCSNDSPVDVFFDNLQVVNKRGALLEETHYYPFGLAMEGISSKRINVLKNNMRFNGKEQQASEFDDSWSSAVYDYGARQYDQQIGRWMGIDSKSDAGVSVSWSPYDFSLNNPIILIDPDGNEVYAIEGGIRFTGADIDPIVKYIVGVLLSGRGLGFHFVLESETPEIYQHTIRALEAGKPFLLTYDPDFKRKTARRTQALRAYTASYDKTMKSLDEYPFASTIEGGFGASVEPVTIRENNIQGGQLQGVYNFYNLGLGDKILVIPIGKDQENIKGDVKQAMLEGGALEVIKLIINRVSRLEPIIIPPGVLPDYEPVPAL